ncbi:MAG: PstS family phosphate ABC transporter substrate-binding protein [Spirochaetes bacterium]|nr:PstS family phosphate ABC transporter substrate-binding protein [Spirochaetota bacterium]
MHEKFFKKVLALAIAITFFAVPYANSQDRGQRIVIKGSTTVLPITQKTSEEYMKQNKVTISIEGSGSGNGIKALLDSTCDIANSSREMKKEELEAAKLKGIAVKEIVLAYDMIVPVVHPSNPVKKLSLDQLKGIYNGTITNWKEVGGKDINIVVVSRDTSSGTYEIWHEKVLKKTDVSNRALLQASNGAVLSTVAVNPKSIGYIGFGYLNNSVKALKVNNIEGTIANGKSGKYPVSRKLFMYVNKSTLSKEADAFIKFMLSKKGQSLVKEEGFIPLK